MATRRRQNRGQDSNPTSFLCQCICRECLFPLLVIKIDVNTLTCLCCFGQTEINTHTVPQPGRSSTSGYLTQSDPRVLSGHLEVQLVLHTGGVRTTRPELTKATTLPDRPLAFCQHRKKQSQQ